jgi:hypothetical protein
MSCCADCASRDVEMLQQTQDVVLNPAIVPATVTRCEDRPARMTASLLNGKIRKLVNVALRWNFDHLRD